MAEKTFVPCAGCGIPITSGEIVNGNLYCSEYCAQINLPILGGNIPILEEDDGEFHPFERE